MRAPTQWLAELVGASEVPAGADVAADLVDALQILGELDSGDDDPPGLMFLEPVDAADQRRLAGAGRAAQHDAFAFAHFQVDALEYMKSAVVLVQPGDIHDYLAGVSDWRHGVYVSRLCKHGVSPVISENARRYRAQGR